MKYHYCFLKRFNNYFNRKIIKYDSLLEYQEHSESFFIPEDQEGHTKSMDFNPNDNVTTEIIVNDIPFDPDYLLIFDADLNIVQRWFAIEQKRNRQGQWLIQVKRDVISDNLDNLYDAPVFVEKGMLKEDDPFIVNSEGMSLNQIKKNEIKLLDKSQSSWIVGYLAKNSNGTDINVQVPNESIKITYRTLGEIAEAIGTTEGVLNSFLNFGDDTSNKAIFNTSYEMEMTCSFSSGETTVYTPYTFSFNNSITSVIGNIGISGRSRPYVFNSLLGQNQNTLTGIIKQAIENNGTSLKTQMRSILGKTYLLTVEQLNLLYEYNGTYIKYNGEYYKLNITSLGTQTSSVTDVKNDGTYSSLTDIINNAVSIASSLSYPLSSRSYSPSPLYDDALINRITAKEKVAIISLKYLSSADFIPQLDGTISSGRNVTADQEYDIFAIPLNIKIDDNGTVWETIEDYSRRIASQIGIQEDAKIYDLQLLPYCPVPNLVTDKNKIKIDNLTVHEDYDFIYKNISDTEYYGLFSLWVTWTQIDATHWTGTATITLPHVPAGEDAIITGFEKLGVNIRGEIEISSYTVTGDSLAVNLTYEGDEDPTVLDEDLFTISYCYPQDNTPCGMIFYVSRSSFSTVIEQEISVDKSKKVVSNCYMWRLVSPNYQGAFDFNIAKNGGKVSSFNVFCTYKPFTPVIKVAPDFNWLYGTEFQDNRGLICAGDFSLPRASDAWESYQLQNKNYQNIFNRDIQHLDFMQSIEMRNQIISGAVGILADASKGATAGGYVAGGIGAIAGGIIGAGVSGAGFAIDVDTLARTQRENRQLAIDKFNYQLGNIKALPYTLTKVGSFDIISKIFPFVEEYSCSEEEITAFERKIQYDSMTVMKIGTLREYAGFNADLHYFKGQLIRNDKIADDSHVLNAIYEELLKGVYI